MLMIWSSRRGTDQPILLSRASSAASLHPMRRPDHASRFEGIAKTILQASRASDTEILQSQVNKGRFLYEVGQRFAGLDHKSND
jgi:hypothetical protein